MILAAIPIGELELSLPRMICYTASSMCAFMGGVTSHRLEVARFFYNNSTTYAGFVAIAVAFIVNGSLRNLEYIILQKLGVHSATHR